MKPGDLIWIKDGAHVWHDTYKNGSNTVGRALTPTPAVVISTRPFLKEDGWDTSKSKLTEWDCWILVACSLGYGWVDSDYVTEDNE